MIIIIIIDLQENETASDLCRDVEMRQRLEVNKKEVSAWYIYLL